MNVERYQQTQQERRHNCVFVGTRQPPVLVRYTSTTAATGRGRCRRPTASACSTTPPTNNTGCGSWVATTARHERRRHAVRHCLRNCRCTKMGRKGQGASNLTSICFVKIIHTYFVTSAHLTWLNWHLRIYVHEIKATLSCEVSSYSTFLCPGI